ncbi:MAG: hypothetical protein CSB46_06215 [Micrococcales bacterium]|nr:MAG: hypothetical protein CSB46_06215 [Micrococcales bacterium]
MSSACCPGASSGGRSRQRLILGGALVAVGLLIMLASLYNQFILGAVVGFAVMLGGASWALAAPKKPAGPEGVVGPGGAVKPRAVKTERAKGGAGTFMQRMESRWEKRREEGDR